MPRLGNRVPQYRRHKQSGQAIVTINGRDYLLGPFGTSASKLEYDRLITEWLSSGRSTAFGVPEHAISIVELIVAYLEYAKGYYGDLQRGEFANMRYALRPLRELYGSQLAREFGPMQLKAVREKFIAAGNSRTYINQQVRRISRVFRWGAAEGLIPADVPQALAMVAGLRKGHTTAPETQKVRPVDDATVEATLQRLSSVVRAMVELQRATGMRPGEVCILRPCDIDRSGDVWEYCPSGHKNTNRERERIVYIGPLGQSILAPYLLRAADAYCFSPAESERRRRENLQKKRKTPLSCGNSPGKNRKRNPRRKAGDRYTSQSYLNAVRRACDKAFPPPNDIADDADAVAIWQTEHRWSPNQLRHTLATRARREFGIETAKVLLGHSQLNTTGIYAEADRRKAIEAVRRIG